MCRELLVCEFSTDETVQRLSLSSEGIYYVRARDRLHPLGTDIRGLYMNTHHVTSQFALRTDGAS